MFKHLRRKWVKLFMNEDDVDMILKTMWENDYQRYLSKRSSDPCPRNAYQIQEHCNFIDEIASDKEFIKLLRVEVNRRFTTKEIYESYGLKTVADGQYACPVIITGVIYMLNERIGEIDDD